MIPEEQKQGILRGLRNGVKPRVIADILDINVKQVYYVSDRNNKYPIEIEKSKIYKGK